MSISDVKISKLEVEGDELIQKIFSRNFLRFNGTIVHDTLASKLDEILNMDVKDEDVWVCSFPKAGTTWTQEMVWCVANDLDFIGAKASLDDRYTFIDMCFLVGKDKYSQLPSAKKINALFESEKNFALDHGPRFIKTHLPYDLLPRKLRDGSTKAKIVCVTRNPKDACISSFHHRKMMGVYQGDLETYCDMFIKNLVTFGPYWKHLLSYWNERNSDNLLLIKYEDMKENLSSVILEVGKLFGKKFNNEEVSGLCDHLSFGNMKNNPAVNKNSLTDMMMRLNSNQENGSFIRKGAVNQWKSELSQQLIHRFEKWEEENLRQYNLTYDTL